MKLAVTVGLILLVRIAMFASGAAGSGALAPVVAQDSGCLTCHAGLEDMHPEAQLSCVDCHGGDPNAREKLLAHVAKPAGWPPSDERVAPLKEAAAWRRFINPMDLRVTERTCGTCHERDVDALLCSLHGTTAGHLSDGYYEMGLERKKRSRYAVFPVTSALEPGGAEDRLAQVPEFMGHLDAGSLGAHFSDLARKECMQCHLYSEGRAIRGRVGFDGDYRGEGCAACHVEYGLDGLSLSADRSVPRREPGHPLRHSMTRAPTTQTCTSCHYGDASIGLHFRGLSQLPPDSPGGPEIPGTTDRLLNRTFYLNDPAICPPDVHAERGMHCIDCHTKSDVMGDGKLHGKMEHAVEITCSACHGTFTRRSELVTERGTPLDHLRFDGTNVVLTGKVSGQQHRVPQVVDVLNPDRAEYNHDAVLAMTPEHERLECYTCHAGWNVNFLGFHFSRNESLTQLDLLSGKRTPGRVTTQEKVFATWKSFYAGWNERGAVAPYLTGFSTMGSVWDTEGNLVIDQRMPETAQGLSGMTMIHHQLHSTRPTARSCVECHRTSSTWGMGSPNFRLARQLAFVADQRGVEVVAINRSELSRSAPLGKLVLPDVVDLAVLCDPLQGHARRLFVAEGGRGIHTIDVTDPTRPKRVSFVASVQPRGLTLAGEHLYLADGIGGLRIYDVKKPDEPELVGRLATVDAHDVAVQWPLAFIADGAGGLVIADVRAPIAPQFLLALDVNGQARAPNAAIEVEALFQYSRPLTDDQGKPRDERTIARNLCALLDRDRGLVLVDVTEPTRPQILHPPLSDVSNARPDVSFRGLALLSQVDPAETSGGARTAERDYAYVLVEARGGNRNARVLLYDVSDPTRMKAPVASVPAGQAPGQLVSADFYNPPFRQRVLLVPGEDGVFLADASNSREPKQIGVLPGLLESYSVAIETFPLDRMLDESGRPLKDVSHPESRWMYRAEIEKVLGVSAEALRLHRLYPDPLYLQSDSARLHLGRMDSDRSGFLEGDEYDEAGGAGVDTDADGRISLLELSLKAGLAGEVPIAGSGGMAATPLIFERLLIDGDLARLLDGTDPHAFDTKGDGLDRTEAESAVFAALDLDDDDRLSQDELSRYPGAYRSLRYADERARKLLRTVDRSGDGRVTRREFSLLEPEWLALDADQDGVVRLERDRALYREGLGFVVPGSEWPVRRTDLFPFPPGLNAEQFLRVFDRDESGDVKRKEMRHRPQLFEFMDQDKNEVLDRAEIDRVLDRLALRGVHATPERFHDRWDIDGDGRVAPEELPSGVLLRVGEHLKPTRRR